MGCGGGPKNFSDSPEAKFPYKFLDLTLRDLDLGIGINPRLVKNKF